MDRINTRPSFAFPSPKLPLQVSENSICTWNYCASGFYLLWKLKVTRLHFLLKQVLTSSSDLYWPISLLSSSEKYHIHCHLLFSVQIRKPPIIDFELNLPNSSFIFLPVILDIKHAHKDQEREGQWIQMREPRKLSESWWPYS